MVATLGLVLKKAKFMARNRAKYLTRQAKLPCGPVGLSDFSFGLQRVLPSQSRHLLTLGL
jgi:hypothetical protein